MMVEFHHGALCDDYEKQANAQGFTFGDDKEWVQNVGYGLVCAHIHGCITDGEYDTYPSVDGLWEREGEE